MAAIRSKFFIGLALALALLVASASSQRSPRPSDLALLARGATFPAPLYQQWMLAFTAVRGNNISFSYIPTGSGDGQRSLLDCNPQCVDFAGSDAVLPESTYANYSLIQPQMLPMVACAVVLTYNLPEVPSSLGRIVFTRDLIVKIFSGEITAWSDPTILSVQSPAVASALSLINANISLVVRSDRSGTTEIFSSALSKFSDTWRTGFGTFQNFPPQNNTNRTIVAPGNEGVFTLVRINKYSLSYNTWSFVKDTDVQYAHIINKAGFETFPNASAVESAISKATFDLRLNADINDLDGDLSYPIVGLTYIIIRSVDHSPAQTCARRRETIKFLNYILTNSKLSQQATALGYSALPKALTETVLAVLSKLECDGKSLLGIDAPLRRDDSIFIPSFVITSILLVSVILAVMLTIFVKKIGQKRSLWTLVEETSNRALAMFLFAFGVLGGSVFMLVAIFFWAVIPIDSSSALCGLRVWFTFVGLSVVIGAQAARASQVSIIRALAIKKTPTTPAYLIARFMRDFLVISIAQVVVLILWQSIDPFRPLLEVTDSLNLEGEWGCASQYYTFPSMEAVFMFVSALYGIYQVYANWRQTTKTSQQMWLLISFYNFLVIFLIAIPLFVFVPGDSSLSIITIVGLVFGALQAVASFLIPVWMNYEKILNEKDKTFSTASRKMTTAETSTDNESSLVPLAGTSATVPLTEAEERKVFKEALKKRQADERNRSLDSAESSDEDLQLKLAVGDGAPAEDESSDSKSLGAAPKKAKSVVLKAERKVEKATWIGWFLSKPNYSWLVKVPASFIMRRDILQDISVHVPNFRDCLRLMFGGIDTSTLNPDEADSLEKGTKALYGLVHAKYIATPAGIALLHDKFESGDYGRCQRVHCRGQRMLPRGGSDDPKKSLVYAFCPSCKQVYNANQPNVDGAWFGRGIALKFIEEYPVQAEDSDAVKGSED